MAARQETSRELGPLDFFISYSPADERWASWIAWTLEEAGYRTVLQAWDFVPGTNFVEFMDRGVTESAAVIAVLSRNYERSRYGRMEWQAALRADPDSPERRLLTVRVEDIPVEGLLATITYVDLVGVGDEAARDLLLTRVRQALDGRARPELQPRYPGAPAAAPAVPHPIERPLLDRPLGRPGWAGRRRPAAPPPYPRGEAAGAGRGSVTVLHLAGPSFGRGADPATLQAAIWSDLVELTDAGAPSPDLLVVTGDLTASGSPRECDQALTFLTGLRSLLGLEPHRLAVVPGGHDVSQAASRAYFNTCEADEMQPRPPYWPKWRHYVRLFRELYQGLDVVFDSDQPWSLFPVPELHTVIAGFNSTTAYSHRPDDRYGCLGAEQAAWFAQALRPYEADGWLRIGALRHPLDTRGGRAAEPLRDTDVLARLAAPRLNLLLHGPAGVRGSASPATALPLASGELPVFGAATPGGHQLLRIGHDGLTRWQEHSGTAPERLQTTWRHVQRAVGTGEPLDTEPGGAAPAVPAQPDTAPGALDSEPRAVDSALEVLVARVAEVCRTRHEGVQLRRVPGPPTHLMATWKESGFVRQQRVAVCVGTPQADDIDAFIDRLHASDAEPDAELVHDGPPPPRELRDRARRHGVRVRSFIEFQGLLDLREYVASQSERLTGDRQYPPALYLPQRYREAERPDGPEHDGLVEDMLRLLEADHGRFVLLLGDFGHGKTFAMREIARRLPHELPHLIPLLIDLSTLDKALTLDGMVAAHLAGHGVDSIDLRAFRYMLRQGRIALLFDGFDELVNHVSYERAADHLGVLLDAAVDNAKIVVSSRTQHFRSQAQILTALGERVGLLPQRRVLALQSFSRQQIRTYLVNRYGGNEEKGADRLRLLDGIPDLLELCRNPRLLSFVADLDAERLRAVAGAGQALSAAGLYQEVLGSWLSFEERRAQGRPGSTPGLTLQQLWYAATALALRLWETGQSALHIDELTDIAETLNTLAEDPLSTPHTAHAVGSGTLLVRADDGLFQFIHRSVAEWLVARETGDRLARGDHELLARRPFSQLAVEFLCDLADPRLCQAWAESVLDRPGRDTDVQHAPEHNEAAQANAVKILARLRVPARTDLRGAVLAGEDLSYRDFSGVDLTGADLTDTRLTGTNFTGAVLCGARLVAARLQETDLTGADLRGADLRRARLVRADLRGAQLGGSRWHQAALISTTTDERTKDTTELSTAAIAPGMPVEPVLRPSCVGVPYGLDASAARLPEPGSHSPNGELLAIGNEDGTVLVCDAVTGRALRTLEGHVDRVYAVKFRDRVIATGAADGTVRLWDPVTGACLHRIEVGPDGVWPVSLNHDGTQLAVGDVEGTVSVWDVASGRPTHQLPSQHGLVYTAQFSPDGNLLATGGAAESVRLWNPRTGRLLAELEGHQGAVYRVKFSPDGTLLATADQGDTPAARLRQSGRRGTVRVWDVAQRRLRHRFSGHPGRVYTLDFHPNGHLLASGDTEGEVRLWNPVSGQPAGRATGCTGAVYQVAFSPDGKLLAAGDSDGLVRLWHVQPENTDTEPGDGERTAVPARQQPPEHRGSVWACRFRPHTAPGGAEDGPLLVTVANDGAVRLWDTVTGRGRPVLRGHGRKTSSLTFSADGSLLAASGNDGVVRLWDTATGRRTRRLTGHNDRLVSAVFGTEGTVLATASNDGDVYLWNAVTGEYQREIDAETDHVWAEAFSTDGQILATANDDDTVQLWYRTTGARVTTFAKHQGRVRSIAFSPDGRQLATGCDDHHLRLWDLDSKTLVAELQHHRDRVYAVCFGPAHTGGGTPWLVTASWDGEAVIWHDGALRHRLTGHTGRLWTAAAHPSRPVVATAGDDRTVRLWNALDGTELHQLTGHTGRVLSVAFTPDGSQLASGGEDGTIRLWHTPAEAAPTLRATLIDTPTGWATLTPSGSYKIEGDTAGEFWHAVGMVRFEPGELDSHLQNVGQLPSEAEI